MDRRSGTARMDAVLIGVLALCGVLYVLALTRWGIGTSPDAIAYIRVARQILEGATDIASQHAPLYALLLAGIGALGVEPFEGARWLNALTFGINVSLVAWLSRQVIRHQPWLALAGAMLVLALTPMLATHVMALSEPIFITCTLAGCWLLARYIDVPTTGRIAVAGAVVSLALLARYAGAAVVLTGGLGILLWSRAAWGRRLAHALLFGAIAAVPLAAWMLRNVATGGAATGRELAFHPIGMSHAWEALFTASGWLLIPPSAPNAIRFAMWAAILGLLALAVRGLQARQEPVPSLVRVLALFVVTYGAFLATSISLLDANTPLDDRILLPALAAGLIVALFALDAIWPVARQRRLATLTLAAGLVLFTAGHAVKAATLATTGYERGWGFSSRTWRESPTIAAARMLPAGRDVYSNAPEILYLHTGQRARNIPRTRFLMNQRENPAFATELDAVGRDMQAGCGALVYFRGLTQKAMPSEQQIRHGLPLVVWTETADGVILGTDACRP